MANMNRVNAKHQPMIASIISMLPLIIGAVIAVIITWVICRLWYMSNYIHRDEVTPLQQSQHIMQNQYSILAERIKNTDNQLAETKEKLEATTEAYTEAMQQLAKYETASTGITVPTQSPDINEFTARILDELNKLVINNQKLPGEQDGIDKVKLKEQFNFIRQAIIEYKSELSQKFYTTSSQYNELSSQVSQLIELNKKLTNDVEVLNKSIQITELFDQSERQFKLTSIKKRS